MLIALDAHAEGNGEGLHFIIHFIDIRSELQFHLQDKTWHDAQNSLLQKQPGGCWEETHNESQSPRCSP